MNEILKEISFIRDIYGIEKFQYGNCAILALYLNKKFPNPTNSFITISDNDSVVHVMFLNKNIIYDISGIQTIRNIQNKYNKPYKASIKIEKFNFIKEIDYFNDFILPATSYTPLLKSKLIG